VLGTRLTSEGRGDEKILRVSTLVKDSKIFVANFFGLEKWLQVLCLD